MSEDREFYGTFIAVIAGLAILAVILVYTAISLTSDVSDYKPEELVAENIKPVGNVYVAGVSEPEEVAGSGQVIATGMGGAAGAGSVIAAAKSGEQVYTSNCLACHLTGAAGAPKLGDVAAWAPRIGAGIDKLVASVTNGLNAMPPMGLCMSCTPEELRAAVEYMVDKSQ